jgi:hypothetical protein
MKRGMYFTMDGVFAAFIIITAAVLLISYTQSTPAPTSLQLTASDTITVLSTLTLGELGTPLMQQVLDTNLTTANDTVLHAIAVLWATNNSLAANFTNATLANLSTSLSYGVYAEGQEIFSIQRSPQSKARFITTAKQQVSGIAPGQPLSGSTATAYLRRIENKSTSSFAYFGGFVGQGNLTVFLELPADVTSLRIQSLVAELDTPQNFTLTINNVFCGYIKPVQWNMTPTAWDLSGCIPLLGPGNNSLRLNYSNLTNAYVAGGYIKATYATDVFSGIQQINQTHYRFPGIEGVANLYDAVLVPQTMRNMTIYLHYTSNDPTVISYLSIGEKTVWSSNQTGEVKVLLTDANFTNVSLDYTFLSNKTVPVRFSSFNSTETILTGGNADIIVITDYSGSMKKDIDTDAQGNVVQVTNCAAVYASSNVRRSHLARCLDKEVVNITMAYTGNRLFPIHYYRDRVYNYTNPYDVAALNGWFETGFPQNADDRTCIACALSEAYGMFTQFNQTNRSRHVILMSDGLPTHCTGAGCTGMSSSYGSLACEGYCDTSGACQSPPSVCTDSQCAPAMTNAYYVAQKLKNDFNATIHTVAFGQVGNCLNATQTLQRIANITNGTYYEGRNVTELRLIYDNISLSILERLQLVSQTVQVPGNVTPSILHNDSYIHILHDPTTSGSLNMIEVTRQSPPFGSCTPTVPLPAQIIIKDAHIVSYSGIHWTSAVMLNNNLVYNLSDFLVPFDRLGDPYRVFLPTNLLRTTNNFLVQTADSPTNITGCSNNNSLVYNALVPSATPRTAVLANATGCTWTIEKDLGGFQTLAIPKSYTGANVCLYTSTGISYDTSDALQEAVFQILRELDFDGDGRIFISLSEENLEIIVTKISSVPYLWGPSLIEVRVWQ